MTQETDTESEPAMRPFDQSGDISEGEAFLVGNGDPADIRRERRKRVRRNLGTRRAERSEQR